MVETGCSLQVRQMGFQGLGKTFALSPGSVSCGGLLGLHASPPLTDPSLLPCVPLRAPLSAADRLCYMASTPAGAASGPRAAGAAAPGPKLFGSNPCK